MTGIKHKQQFPNPTPDDGNPDHACGVHWNEEHDIDPNTIGDADVAAHTTSKITVPTSQLSGRVALGNMPDGVSGNFLKALGAGMDPAYAALAAADILSGVFDLARIPTMDDAHIPDLETLSYGAAFAVAQIPNLPASKITSGILDLARIPNMDDAHVPDLETLSYGGAFADAQIPSLATSKITSGIFPVARGGSGLGTLAAGGILYISALNTLSRIAPSAANQVLRSTGANALVFGALVANDIPNLPASKITSGILEAARGGLGKLLDPTFNDNYIPVYKSATDKFVMEDKGTPSAHKDTHKSGGSDAFTSTDLLEAHIKRILESSGPTTLTVGAVADGEYLRRSGTNIVGGAGGSATTREIVFGGVFYSVTGQDWNSAGGDTGYTFFKKFSGTELRCGGTTGYDAFAMATIYENNNAPYPAIFSKNPEIEFYISMDSVSNVKAWVFIGGDDNDPEKADEKKFGIYIVDGALYLMSCNGTTYDTQDESVTLTQNVVYRIRIQLTATALKLWVDGVAKTDKTDYLPSAGWSSWYQGICQNVKTTEDVQKRLNLRSMRFYHDY